ncbi:YggS family pyridoxal phosphate-dependent enzyme [Duganella sp. FT50W]|uniref:Pyridoxal phosphate homeostasis protein n=1 Tax=Duganella lactea TaxID=2692173 RepID=A0A6L8MPF0_9BURK|nr:YggS family pyridoxal phosphate-dependent enzyme [Duganella lactea]MYM34169.1 YggS family pyridoxal phosphate-dependent enzyme [Duganella lactea]MYM81408.1 YggS family pyridoxal phosphate-dependent enzyme [Duganella lactea]
MSPIRQNLQAVTATIVAATQESGRAPDAVRLLAVSKTFGPEAVLAAVAAGQRAFGENYLQEGLDKIRAVRQAGAPALAWHFIGPIQSNKTRPIAEHFDWVHTVEREKIAQRLSEQRPAGMAPLQICLQVNISGEASKSGVAPDAVAALAHQVAALPRLTLRGLMAIPEPAVEFEQQRAAFARLRVLYEQLRADGLALDTLSMGMSADLRAAVFEGATMVRVGSAIFGARNYNKV